MKKYLFILVLILILLCPAAAIASDLSEAEYIANVEITNNGTAAYYVSTTMTLDTDTWISTGYINSDCSNTAIRGETDIDIAYMPGYDGNPWCIWEPGISADETEVYKYYQGDITDDLNGKLRYFPASGGMVTSDAAGLEYGDNFTWEYSGYVSMGGTGNLTYKDGAFWCGVTNAVTDEITVQIYGTSANVVATGINTGEHEISVGSETGNFTQLSSPNAINLSGTGSTMVGERFDSLDGSVRINSVALSLRKFGLPTGTANITVRDSTTDDLLGIMGSIDVSTLTTTEFVWHTFDDTDINTTDDFRILVEYQNGDGSNYMRIGHDGENLYSDGKQTVNYIAGGWGESDSYDIAMDVDASWLTMDIDGTEYTGPLATVPNNANDWVDGNYNRTPYIEYVKRYVGGTLQQNIEWEYGATFTDLSGNGNDATPNFRTTTSDADVTAELIELNAYAPAEVTSWTLAETYSMIQTDDLPSTPAETYTELETTNLFMAPVFDVLIANTDYEPATFWFPVTILVIGLLGIGVHMLTKSMLVQAIVQAFAMAIASCTVIPWWCMIVFLMYAFAIVLASNRLPGGI